MEVLELLGYTAVFSLAIVLPVWAFWEVVRRM
jgi:hypothetical protein